MRPRSALLCALFALGMFVWPATPARAESGTASSVREFNDLLVTYRDASELTIMLGDNITFTDTESCERFSGDKLTINTGSYGLKFENTSPPSAAKECTITGEGINPPVLELCGGSWYEVARISVTATGKNDVGGTAVLISQDDGVAPQLNIFTNVQKITAFGENAVGLRLTVPAQVYCLTIEASGKNSAAVVAEQDAGLHFCRLNASGEGAAAVAANSGVLLDTCTASPFPLGANFTATQQRLTGFNPGLYVPVMMNSPNPLNMPTSYQLTFTDDGGNKSTHRLLIQTNPSDENEDLFGVKNIPKNVPGRYIRPFPFSLWPQLCGFGLETGFPLEIIVDVRDPAIPFISDIYYYDYEQMVELSFWAHPDSGSFILWFSDDNGQSWQDITTLGSVEWTAFSSVCFTTAEEKFPMLFQLELPDRGESNVAKLEIKDTQAEGDIGGDRTGDRVIKGDPDPLPSQPPLPSAPNNGVDGGTIASQPTARTQPTTAQDTEPPYDAPLPQPAQSTVGESPAKGSGPEEWEDANGMGISGKRLSVMLETNPQTVTIIKQGMQISIPSEALRALDIKEDQLFAITVEKHGDGFLITFEVDGETVTLPFTATFGGASLAVSGSLAMPAAQADASADQPHASEIRLDALPAQAAPTPRKAAFPLWAGLTIGGVALGGGALFAFRRTLRRTLRRVFQR